ncbi:MAG: sensor histidine kinase [Candidatus Kerfeldbacteria bacterium]|nr:sensor histidine kinase [Candidatus Kerfeldbacteria bacterium]
MSINPVSFINSRLERKLALLLSLVALVSLFVFAWLSIRLITVTREQNIGELEWQLANQTSDRLRKFIFDKLESFRIIVADPNVTAIGHEQQVFILQSQLQNDTSLTEVSFIRPDGHELWREVRGSKGQLQPPNLRVFDENDKLVATVKQGKNYLGPVVFKDNKSLLVLASPVINYQGEIIAILRGEADLKMLTPLVIAANLGSSGYLYLLDEGNHLLTSSSNFIKQSYPVGYKVTSSEQVAWRQDRPGDAVLRSEYGPSPLSKQAVFSVSQKINQLDWLIRVEWPEAEAMEILPQIITQLILAAVILLIILGSISILAARKISRPIHKLSLAASSIGQGKFDVSLPTVGQDEVGQLAREFSQMLKGLQELEKLKDEFVFIAAHELRTPVTAIRGYAEMLTDLGTSLPPQAKEFTERLQQSGSRLANLVNDLLEVARDQAGRLKCETSPQNLMEIVQGVISELAPLVKEKEHTLQFQPPGNLPPVLVDKDKLQEVLVNLVSNAIKYTPPRGTIKIDLMSAVGEVTVSVQDNGIGISAEDQAKLFRRFYRVESDETRNIQGTGLGLFIVRQLVERMGGKIWVESEKGKGTTFRFTLKTVTGAS